VVRLIDLGLSALLAGVVRSTLAAGARLPSATTPYSSPEQVRGGELTAASDLYSAGALLYELLVGQPPHGAVAQSAEGLRRAILGHEAEPPSAAAVAPVVVDAGVGSLAARWPDQMAARRGTDPAGLSRQLAPLDDLVLRMLAKDPAARPPSAEAVDADLVRLAGP
jgi:serine/threonine protein kinase